MDEVFQTAPETPELIKADVTGTIPKWVNGTLLRNAPAKFEFDKEQHKHAFKHWFDGLALLHAFSINEGEVTYKSKYLRTQAFVKGEEQKRPAYTEFGTAEVPDPCENIFSRFFSYFTPLQRSDNSSVNIVEIQGRLFANSDSRLMAEVDPSSLDLLDFVNIKKDLNFKTPEKMVYASSHPHEDVNGNVFNIMISLGSETRHNIVQIPPSVEGANHMKKVKSLEGAKVVASFLPHNPFVYYHSFGLTPNYFIFVENPFIISPFRLLTMKILQRSVYECLYWDAKEPSRFYLIDRKSGSCVATYETHNFFMFHHVNAYEDGHEVVVDLCCYPDSTIIDKYYLYNLRNSRPEEASENFANAEVRRYRLEIPGKNKPAAHSGRLVYEILGSHLELPRINYRRNGEAYRFVYGTGLRKHGHFDNQLIKLDTKMKGKKTWYELDCYPSEPVFIERPGATDEDDGVILSAVVGTRGRKSFMVVLDASTFQELARATVPIRLPPSSHGNFFPSLSYKLEDFHADRPERSEETK